METAQDLPALGQGSLGDLDDEPRLDAGTRAEMGRQHGQPFGILQGSG